ncbi:MAG: META domain-containing protein [Fidelibacterota bacterium]|nr:MAG: META domain-containing protein [Candidatus Neomarinimicrobiota bacterium]
MKCIKHYFLTICFSIAVLSCTKLNNSTDVESSLSESALADLVGVEWIADSLMFPEGSYIPEAHKPITLEFTDDGRVGGKAICNGYNGVYETGESGDISIDLLRWTEIACHPPLVDVFYFELLEVMTYYERMDNKLYLQDTDSLNSIFFTAAE